MVIRTNKKLFLLDRYQMLGGLPVINWFMEYRRMALVEHHNTCAGLVFTRVLYEIAPTTDVIPCNALMRKAVSKYKGKLSILGIKLSTYFESQGL